MFSQNNHSRAPAPSSRSKAAAPNARSPLTAHGNDHHNLFVACLPRNIDNAQLLQIFAEFNPMQATVMMDVRTGRSKGFAFVLFALESEGRDAVERFHRQEITAFGQTFAMHVGPSKFNGFASVRECNTIYVRNLPFAVSADGIRELFSQFGAITALEIRPDRQGNGWMATLEYASVVEAKAAIDGSHARHLFPELSNVPVMAKFAETAAVKTHRLSKQLAANPVRHGYHAMDPRFYVPMAGASAPAPFRSPRPPGYESAMGDFHGDGVAPSDEYDSGSGEGFESCGHQSARSSTRSPVMFRHDPYNPEGFYLVPTH